MSCIYFVFNQKHFRVVNQTNSLQAGAKCVFSLSRKLCYTSLKNTVRNQRLENKPVHSKGKQVVILSDNILDQLKIIYGIERDVGSSLFKSAKFGLVSDDAIINNIHLLKKHHVPCDQLKRNPWILLQNPKKLNDKFKNLTKPAMFDSVSDGLGFCCFSVKSILQHQEFFCSEAPLFPKHRNRLYYISESLNVPVAHIVEKVRGPHFIIYTSMDKIHSVIELMKRYNVPKESIASDLWIFRYHPEQIEPKLRAVKDAGWLHPKPWVGRAPDKVLERTVLKYEKEKSLLEEYGTLERLLACKLNCTEDEAKNYVRSRCFTTTSLNVINSKLMFLFASGFTPEDIRKSPSVLKTSLHRMEQRTEELKELGYDLTSTFLLYTSDKMYREFCSKLEERNESI